MLGGLVWFAYAFLEVVYAYICVSAKGRVLVFMHARMYSILAYEHLSVTVGETSSCMRAREKKDRHKNQAWKSVWEKKQACLRWLSMFTMALTLMRELTNRGRQTMNREREREYWEIEAGASLGTLFHLLLCHVMVGFVAFSQARKSSKLGILF